MGCEEFIWYIYLVFSLDNIAHKTLIETGEREEWMHGGNLN